MRLCLFFSRQFEEAFENAQWRKIKQMQPMWLCIPSGRRFEDTFEKTQWRKVKQCNQCDFASADSSNLRNHLKRHSGEKSNKCNQCDFASADSSNLRKHLKRHSGEKSNKCNQCDFASTQTDDLRRHVKTHSGKISRASKLRMHLKTHRGKRVWKRAFLFNFVRKICQKFTTFSRWGGFIHSCHYGLFINDVIIFRGYHDLYVVNFRSIRICWNKKFKTLLVHLHLHLHLQLMYLREFPPLWAPLLPPQLLQIALQLAKSQRRLGKWKTLTSQKSHPLSSFSSFTLWRLRYYPYFSLDVSPTV